MASPQLRLLELLQIDGVKTETRAIFTTLLRRCFNDGRLSAFVLRSVDENLQVQDQVFNLATLDGLVDCVSCPPMTNCARLRTLLLSSVADALNQEAYRWMSDFLLIAIGKRAHQHRMFPSHPRLQNTASKDICIRYDLEKLWNTVFVRDGPRCCVSGAIHNVACVQLIPSSDDAGRVDRFRVLARVFFQAEIPTLDDAQLKSTENACMISMFWKDRLDKGHLIFKFVGDELHAIPLYRDDSDGLAEERQANGVHGPSLLGLYDGPFGEDYPRIHPQLVWLHRVLIETWQETGLADQLVNNIEWIDRMPKRMQSTRFLDPLDFGMILKHKLAIM